MSPALSAPFRRALLPACLLLGALVSVRLGQDANWDLRNYHIYTLNALLAGRFDTDLMAAGLQTYFNPTLDIPYILLAFGPLADAPRLLAAAMGLWFGGLLYVTLRIAALLLAEVPQPQRAIAASLGTLTAATASATLSQAGTTFNEIQTALLILGGVFWLLRGIDRLAQGGPAPARLPWGAALGAGTLFGLAAGMKLTAGTFAPAACLALLAVARPLAWFRLCLAFSAGWALGFLPPFAWWALFLWERFESPTFLLFNAIFRSPWYPPESFFDARFFPRDALQWMFYPFHWAIRTRSSMVTELALRDPRLAIAYAAVAAMALAGAWRRLRGGATAPRLLTPPQRFALAFLALAYLFWLLTSSILRYAVTIEILGVLAILVAAAALARPVLPAARWRWVAPAAAALLAAICIPATRPIDWGRVPFGPRVFAVEMGWAQPRTLFVSITGPTAYLAAFVPPETQARFVGFGFTTLIAREWRLGRESLAMVRGHDGPIVVLVPEDMMSFTRELPAIGLSPQLGPCRPVRSNLDADTVLACEAERLPDAARAPGRGAAAWRHGRTASIAVDFPIARPPATPSPA